MPRFIANKNKKQFKHGDQILVTGDYARQALTNKGLSPVLTVSMVSVEYDMEQYPESKWTVKYICIDDVGKLHPIFPWEIKPIKRRA